MFNITNVSRTGRQRRTRITVDPTICDCDKEEIVDRTTDSWRSDPNLIECRGSHCETHIVGIRLYSYSILNLTC